METLRCGPPPKEIFFTLIVPVYNVEHHIARCLKSCTHQTFRNIEILIIDDCGTDSSITIAKEFAKTDPRIRIIHHTHNRGLFYARITGETEAKGRYILHIDSDDFISTQTCQEIYNAIQFHYRKTQQWVDICTFGYQTYPKIKKLSLGAFNHKATQVLTKQWKNRYSSQPIICFFLAPIICWNIWARAYRTELVHQTNQIIQSQIPDLGTLTMGEDVLKFFFLASQSLNNLELSKQYYFYCDNPTSIMREQKNIQKIKKYIKDLKKLVLIFQEFNSLQSNQKDYYRATRMIQESLDIHRALLIQRYFSLLKKRFKASPWKKLPFLAYPAIYIKPLYSNWSWKPIIRVTVYFASLGKIQL